MQKTTKGNKKKVKFEENCKPPHIYAHPEICKPETTLWPVMNYIGSAVHPLAEHLFC